MATRVDIANAIALLRRYFPNFQPDDKTPDAWLLILCDLPSDTLSAAIMACSSENRAFAPSVGEIRNMAIKLNAQAAGIPDAWQAYDEVVNMPPSMEKFRVTGEYDESGAAIRNRAVLKFSHPLVEQVARLMGWPRSFPTDMPGVDRAQFVKAYDAELQRYAGQSGQHPAITEYVENKRLELAGKAPALVSQVAKRLGAGK